MWRKQAGHSGGFRSNFRIAFNKELQGKRTLEAPEVSGVISVLFLIRDCKEKTILRIHGVGQKMCGKRQPLGWAGLGLGLAGLRPKKEAGGSGGFRLNFLIVLHKELCKEKAGWRLRRFPEQVPSCF